MPYSEAQNKATQKYQKKAYDQIAIRVSKGKREEYKRLAESRGISLSTLITSLLDQELTKQGQ